MVTKDSFETAYKGKITSCSSMEQAVGGLWCVFTLVLTDQRQKEVIFVFKGLKSLDFVSFGMAPGIIKYIRTQRGHQKIV